ncbi:MAG: hypothetical protein PHT69_05320 [Bacteroidales bacterium]|nr:hypothetical protein [Bacteroidales bacterium]
MSVAQQFDDCELYNLAIENFISSNIGVSSNKGLSYKYKIERNNIFINNSLIFRDSLISLFGLFQTIDEKEWVKENNLERFYSVSFNKNLLCTFNKFDEDTLFNKSRDEENPLCMPNYAFISFSNIFHDNYDSFLLFGLWNTYSNNKVYIFFVFKKNNNEWETIAYKYLLR